MADPGALDANAERFAGSAELYDAVRSTAPDDLATMLVAYAGGGRPALVVDLGCGSGLSARWAATWSDLVVGVEPGDAMRAIAGVRGDRLRLAAVVRRCRRGQGVGRLPKGPAVV